MENILEVKNLTKVYKNNRGVQNISLDIYQGDVFGFLGPNGAGKTTVMKLITGLCKADQGEVRIFGLDINNNFALAMSKVGVLVESPDAYEYMSAYKNLELAARFYPEIKKTRLEEVLELVGLKKYKSDYVSSYSSGMKQRLGIAQAILSKPELVILDEPVNGLDIEGMVDMRNLIINLAREQRTTFLISSHLIHEIELICNRIGIINQGQLIKQGLVAELLTADCASLEEYFIKQVKGSKGGCGDE